MTTVFGRAPVRLNKAYRAMYVEGKANELELLEVLEVNEHEY